MEKIEIETLSFETFDNYYKKLNVPSKYDEKFLFELFNNLIESYNSNVLSKINNDTFKNINLTKLFLYLISEYDFIACNLSDEEIQKMNGNDELLTGILSVTMDKYITNENIDLNETVYVSKYSPKISVRLYSLIAVSKGHRYTFFVIESQILIPGTDFSRFPSARKVVSCYAFLLSAEL